MTPRLQHEGDTADLYKKEYLKESDQILPEAD